MNLDRYDLKSGKHLSLFEFTSEGPKGRIEKIIQFTRLPKRNTYNLAFGDQVKGKKILDDDARSNNGDNAKVLATVAVTVRAFLDKKPNACVYAKGNTKARNRLYRMGISKILPEIVEDFEIFGLNNDQWQEFTKNVEYDAFLIRKKLTLKYEIKRQK